MANSQIESFFSNLTTLKGALFAAPLVIGAGLLISLYNQSSSQAKFPEVQSSANSADITAPIVLAKSENSLEDEATSSATSSFSAEQQSEIGQIIRNYLLANPEILQQVGEELSRRQHEAQEKRRRVTLKNKKDEIFRSPMDFALGDQDADVTIVEYFDYNCGWCKRALNEVTKISQSDQKIRVVMKEFPIFGEHSEFAARAAMASKEQGKYWDYHVALMKEKRITKDNALKIAEKVGIDVEKLQTEMKKPKYAAAIKRTQTTALALGIEGTPGFIVDDKINPGFVPAEKLKAMVADIRKSGCVIC